MVTKTKPQKTTILLDGDIAIYQIAVNQEHEVNFEPENPDSPTILFSYLEDCQIQFKKYINYLKDKLQAPNVVVTFSDKNNFRKTVYPSYKSNRIGTRKPIAFSDFKGWVKQNYTTIIKPGLEADDVLGILATLPSKEFMGRRVIVSIDKDMEQIPGYIFNPNKDETIRTINKADAQQKFWMQVLTGDATDGYPGCPGLGPKGAEKIVYTVPEEEMWDAIVKAYEKKGLTEADALTQARCAKLLTADNWDFKESKVILWEPKRVKST